jgi:hypothetical protein
VIYIVHVIILYGGIFGVGLYPHVLNQSMTPLSAALFSAGFVLFFIGLVWVIEKKAETK